MPSIGWGGLCGGCLKGRVMEGVSQSCGGGVKVNELDAAIFMTGVQGAVARIKGET